MGKQFTQAQFKKAIPGSGGIIATIAKRVGCSWHTAQAYIRDVPELATMYEDEAETVDDMAESVVIKAIQRGDIASAKWWLERRRRAQFTTRVEAEVSGKDGRPIQVEHGGKVHGSVEHVAAVWETLVEVGAIQLGDDGPAGDAEDDAVHHRDADA